MTVTAIDISTHLGVSFGEAVTYGFVFSMIAYLTTMQVLDMFK